MMAVGASGPVMGVLWRSGGRIYRIAEMGNAYHQPKKSA